MPSSVIPQSESAVLITVEGLEQYWETFSGIKDTASSSDEYSDGLSNRLYKIEGPCSLDEIEITKAFDRKSDRSIIDYWLQRRLGRGVVRSMTVAMVEYTPEPQPDESIILFGVRPVSIELASADKKSNNVMRMTLRLVADDWKFG